MGYFNKGSGGSGTPAGSNMQVQFNDAGAFGGGATLVWDKVNGRFGIGTDSPTKALDVRGDSVVYSSNDPASEGFNVVNTGYSIAGYNLHRGYLGQDLSTCSLKGYLRVDHDTDGLILGTYEQYYGDHTVMVIDNVLGTAKFITGIIVNDDGWSSTTLDQTSLNLNTDGRIEFDGGRFIFSAFGDYQMVIDMAVGRVMFPNIPTSDPHDGQGALWMDDENGRVIKVGT